MDREETYDLEQNRIAFQNVFRDHPSGPLVLSIIRNQLGVNNFEAEKVVPELVVLDHWLLYMIGVKHEQNFLNETKGLLAAVNDDDITSNRRRIAKEKKDETD